MALTGSDAIECDACGADIEHDEFAYRMTKGYNMGGSWMQQSYLEDTTFCKACADRRMPPSIPEEAPFWQPSVQRMVDNPRQVFTPPLIVTATEWSFMEWLDKKEGPCCNPEVVFEGEKVYLSGITISEENMEEMVGLDCVERVEIEGYDKQHAPITKGND